MLVMFPLQCQSNCLALKFIDHFNIILTFSSTVINYNCNYFFSIIIIITTCRNVSIQIKLVTKYMNFLACYVMSVMDQYDLT